MSNQVNDLSTISHLFTIHTGLEDEIIEIDKKKIKPVVVDADCLIVGARGDEAAVRGEPRASHPVLVVRDRRDEFRPVHSPQLDTFVVGSGQEVLPIHRVEFNVSGVNNIFKEILQESDIGVK